MGTASPVFPLHLACSFASLSWDAENVGGLLHDPDEQVVDVVLQLADLKLFLADGLLLFEDQLDKLLMGQLGIGKGRV